MSLAEFVYTTVLKPPPLRVAANAVLRAISRRKVSVDGATVMLNPADPVISGALTLGIYERDELAFIRRVCRPGMAVLDIGANVGLYTSVCAKLTAPTGRVVAVEPDPENLFFLGKTVAANPDAAARATIIAGAAGERPGVMSLFQSSANRGDHRLYAHADADSEMDVAVVRLDDVLHARGVHGLHLIKIDVQGYEAQALRGAAGIIDASPNLILLSEFWPEGLRQAGGEATAYLDWLRARGFALHRLTKGGVATPIADDAAFIASLPGRKYANIIGVKGDAVV